MLKISKNIFCLLQNTTICALKFTVWCKHIFINNKQNRWAAEKTFYPHGLIKKILIQTLKCGGCFVNGCLVSQDMVSKCIAEEN